MAAVLRLRKGLIKVTSSPSLRFIIKSSSTHSTCIDGKKSLEVYCTLF